MKNFLLILSFLITSITTAQSLDGLDDYDVDAFYKKEELEDDTLDEDGNEIEFIFVKTETDLKTGKYEIELADGPGDLYEIKGTEFFVKLKGYYGYAGFGEDCILEITGSYFNKKGTIYKLD